MFDSSQNIDIFGINYYYIYMREMPKPMQDVMDIKNKIKKDNPDINDSPGLTAVVWGLYKSADNDSTKAFNKYKSIKDKFAKMVEDKNKEMAAKRARK